MISPGSWFFAEQIKMNTRFHLTTQEMQCF